MSRRESEIPHPESPEELLRQLGWTQRLAHSLVHDAHFAEDVAQESVFAALGGRRPENPESWLARIVRNRSVSLLRREHRRAAREEQHSPRPGPDDPAEILERAELQRDLVEAVFTLSEPARSTIILRYFEGWKTARIAEAHDVEPATVRSRLRRGLEQLRERLDARYGDRERWRLAWLPFLPDVPAPVPPGSATSPASPLVRAARPIGIAIVNTKIAALLLALAIVTALGWYLWSPDPEADSITGTSRTTLVEAPETTSTNSGLPANASDSELAATSAEPDGPERATESVATGPGTIFGRVWDETGAPVAGAVVHALPPEADFADIELPFGLGRPFIAPDLADPSHRTVTDSAGAFRIEGLELLEHSILVRHPSHQHEVEHGLRLTTTQPSLELGVILLAGYRIAGRVVDPDGRPLANARVFTGLDLVAIGGKRVHLTLNVGQSSFTSVETTTDEAGRFLLEGLPFGNQRLVADHPRYARTRRDISSGSDGVELRLHPYGTIAGRVDDEHGEPLRALRVRLLGAGQEAPLWTETDAEGRFRFDRLHSGEQRIGVTAPSFGHGLLARYDLAPGESLEDVELVVTTGGEAFGQVVDPSGNPVAGATVEVEASADSHPDERFAVTTGPDGNFVVEPLLVGCAYDFEISHPRLGTEKRTDRTATREPLDLGVVTIGAGLRVEGVVLDEHGLPIPFARVELSEAIDEGLIGMFINRQSLGIPGQHRDDTDDQGRYTITNVKPGAYELSVTAHGYVGHTQKPLDIHEGMDPTLDPITLATGAMLDGILVDPTGRPVAGGRVRATRTFPKLGEQRTTTGPDGRFVLRGLEPGRYEVTGTADGWSPSEARKIAAGEDGVTLELRAPGRVIGTVSGSDEPLTEFRVQVTADQAGFRLNVAELIQQARLQNPLEFQHPQGEFDVPELDPGRYTIRVLADGWIPSEHEVTIREGRTERLDVELAPAGTVVGRVVDAHGEPIADARVSTKRSEGGPRVTSSFTISFSTTTGTRQEVSSGAPDDVRTDENGEYRITGLEPGLTTLEIRHDEFEEEQISVRVQEGEIVEAPDARLYRGASVSGQLVDTAGEPVAHAFLIFEPLEIEGQTRVVATTEKDGTFVRRGLMPGRYSVRVERFEGGLEQLAERVAAPEGLPGTVLEEIEVRPGRDLERQWVVPE